ncbi:kinesin-domain-containing protein [Coniophora puteana RWD-64-598 SS2]|uniref:Kinesin-like protein n=1 Tax=Coniophora puteana (strain RWD-64-598) TaxID=741705 RepID=A0A5M3N6J3_CONPW|nr:kinesin-domain-containing protein [Coniophora puteana RWD-64-598 SS2]EIW86481.1 kinesin-domain-containing protein [Coniophora puteana RWD-64-598 SS2]
MNTRSTRTAGAASQATRASARTRTPTIPAPSPSPPLTKSTRTKTPVNQNATAQTSTLKPAGRKPLSNRANSPDKPVSSKKAPTTASKPHKGDVTEREPIMAYLRIRPALGEEEATTPYLDPLSDTSVRMTDPASDAMAQSRFHYRMSMAAPSSIYKFSHIFPPSTQQPDFFAKTTLPLVKDVLEGQNGLLFAYGVTNSGKTYTIQGGNKGDSAGILPRTLDVIFNSVNGLQGDGRFRPVRLYGAERCEPGNDNLFYNIRASAGESSFAAVLSDLAESTPGDIDTDPTTLKLDRNYEYSIWLSYAEIYNEKVYDLLGTIEDDDGSTPGSSRRNTTAQTFGGQTVLTRKALTVKPSPASDSIEGITGKYIADLRHFRVTSATEAKELVKLGQVHRRVFGTLANAQSSRSHGMVTIKVLRSHRGERNNPDALQMSRLTLVDLAGSERTKHTHTTGDRLREAGNINKSLMVLGQCMEVMRSNQNRVAQSLSGPGRSDTKVVRKGLALVPFRHSKLTEVLMDYFEGDGRVVMIVNVNPYDTGYDENSHVMKFSALAREVHTATNNAPAPRVLAAPTKPGPARGPLKSGLPPPNMPTRKVTISSVGPNRRVSEAHLEIVEEDEESGPDDEEDDEDEEPINPLVDALFDEVEQLRMKLHEAELRCAVVEAETREEVMKEMEERMLVMQQTYSRRLMSELERNEKKMDAKIDMLHQAGLFGQNGTPQQGDIEDEDMEADESYMQDREPGFSDESGIAPSPLAGKTAKTKAGSRPRPSEIEGSESEVERSIAIEDDDEDEVHGEDGEEEEELDEEPLTEDDEEDDYVPSPPIKQPSRGKPAPPRLDPPSKGPRSSKPGQRKVSTLVDDMDRLGLDGDADDSVIIVPDRKARKAAVPEGIEYVPRPGVTDVGKKKKRYVLLLIRTRGIS